MPESGPALIVSLLALALALTALWLVTDMVKRMVTEAKALVDASVRGLWKQQATVERTMKSAIENQRMMAEEIANLRRQLDERERRERDLAGRITALTGELDRQATRMLALITAAARPAAVARTVAPAAPRPVPPPPTGDQGSGLAQWLADPDDEAAPGTPAPPPTVIRQ